MKNTAIITARMTSARLPGKVLLQNKHSNTIGLLIDRLKRSKLINEIIIATSINKADDELVIFLEKNQIKYFRGSEQNVLERVCEASSFFNSDLVTLITGDCPLIEYELVDQCIRIFYNNDCDFVTNANIRSFPDGMDCQIVSSKALKKSNYLEKKNKFEEEHVTLNIRRNKDLFKTLNVISSRDLYWPELGLTLDEEGDYKLISKIIDNLYFEDSYFNCLDIINFLKINYKLLDLNKSVKRKGDF